MEPSDGFIKGYFPCKKCLKTFQYQYELDCHVKIHNTCNKCPKTFKYNRTLKRHVKTHNITKLALLETDNNGELSETQGKVVNSSAINKQTTPSSKNCRFCGEKFKHGNEFVYRKHILKHKLDQFSCDCEKYREEETHGLSLAIGSSLVCSLCISLL